MKRTKYEWTLGELRQVDKSIYLFLQTLYLTRLITENIFSYSTVCQTNLLNELVDDHENNKM